MKINKSVQFLLCLLIGLSLFFALQHYQKPVQVFDQVEQNIDEDVDFLEQNQNEFICDEITEHQIIQQLVEQHGFKPLHKKVFHTPQERQEFFDSLGIEYLNNTSIEYAPIHDSDCKQSEKYTIDPEFNDLLTQSYAQDIAEQNLMPISIRWIASDVGHGVFAEDDLPKGGFIGIYAGVVKDKSLVHDKDYAWSYPMQTVEGGPTTLDAAKKGNELRLINDGKDPNCVVQYVIGLDGLWHVCYVAAKDIKKDEQLLVSYGPAYWETRKYAYQELVH